MTMRGCEKEWKERRLRCVPKATAATPAAQTAKMMLEQGVPEEDVRRATFGNAAKAYGYSGQIDMDALEKKPAIDQRQLFNDNSVLRGQEARVDDGVAN